MTRVNTGIHESAAQHSADVIGVISGTSVLDGVLPRGQLAAGTVACPIDRKRFSYSLSARRTKTDRRDS